MVVSMRACRGILPVTLLAWAAASAPLAAIAQPAPVAPGETATAEVDPLRCWWRTSAGAVRTGSTFSLDLTCAVLENEAVQVVPDESRLGGDVIQMAPFEVVDSARAPDLRSGQRRFFQYHYSLRVINSDLIGKDVSIPDLVIRYHVNSRLAGNAALQGRDLEYVLPPQAIRVISMVPGNASDIRDASGQPFGEIESLMFRASALDIATVTLAALGSLMALVAVIRVGRSARRGVPAGERAMGSWRVARLVSDELSSVRRDSDERGWDEAIVGRALAASRVAAAIALGRRVSERAAEAGAASGEGLLVARPGRGRRLTSVSSSVTAEDLAREMARSPDDQSRQTLEGLQQALTVFGRSQYGREPVVERGPLDAALTAAADAARRLKSRHTWAKAYLRSTFGVAQAQDQI